jgi:hypothetical protein
VPAPPLRLTRDGWEAAAAASRGREDSCGDCAICREPFRAEEQVNHKSRFAHFLTWYSLRFVLRPELTVLVVVHESVSVLLQHHQLSTRF